MFTKNQIRANLGRKALIVLATGLIAMPGFASADEPELSEIRVVATALNTEALQREVADKSIAEALERVRAQIAADTKRHVNRTVRNTPILIVAGKSAKPIG